MAFSPESVQTPSSPSPTAPPLSPPSPSGVERAATLPAAPPMATAPRSAPDGAPGDPPGLPVAPSTNSPAPLATARAAITAPGAPSTPQPHASPRAPVGAEPAGSRKDEAASRQARTGIPDAGPVDSAEHTRGRIEQRPAVRAANDRDVPAHEAPIAQIETTTSPGARTEPAAPQATRAAVPAPLEPIPPAARYESFVPSPRAEVSPGARAREPRRPERPSPMPEPVAAPRVHIGRLEVIVVAPPQPPARPAQRGSADLASRRYLRNA